MLAVVNGALSWHLVRAALAGVLALLPLPTWAEDPVVPRVHTNQTYLEELQQTSGLDIADPLAVFAMVFASLPASVRVYPTESYYYFHFVHNNRPFGGSFRLDPRTREEGKIEFGYYQGLSLWKDEGGVDRFLVLDQTHGVKVERVERLVYRVSYKDKSVVFALNDLSGVKAPPAALGADEKYFGPIFDESGIRFLLVYNTRLKAFHYILDETVNVADEFYAAKRVDRIVIGRRTGFAFYRDHRLDRKILIGAFEGNTRVNNWFDGPFDQLPENFIEGEDLREAIIAADPSVKGQIDRLGHYLKEEGRYVISPYMHYKAESDLLRIHACASSRLKRPNYHRCFVVSHEGQIDPPLPREASKEK